MCMAAGENNWLAVVCSLINRPNTQMSYNTSDILCFSSKYTGRPTQPLTGHIHPVFYSSDIELN